MLKIIFQFLGFIYVHEKRPQRYADVGRLFLSRYVLMSFLNKDALVKTLAKEALTLVRDAKAITVILKIKTNWLIRIDSSIIASLKYLS